jgi:hypothetical protein
MFQVIQQIILLPNYRLGLLYQDGAAFIVDFKPLIAEGGVFSPLSHPPFFTQVQLGPRGRFIVWPGDLDFCADALRLDGQPADLAQIKAESRESQPV